MTTICVVSADFHEIESTAHPPHLTVPDNSLGLLLRRSEPETPSQWTSQSKIHRLTLIAYLGLNRYFLAEHIGHSQSAGMSSKAVPGAIPEFGSPVAGS